MVYFSGSSPCLRGTLHRQHPGQPNSRFIPVLTGNTAPSAALTGSYAVHPRAYGEHWCQVRVLTNSIGSSPCLRGTLLSPHPKHPPGRFIPVLTGNTCLLVYLYMYDSVHPRAYGEHSVMSLTRKTRCGSSPCLRGTRNDYLWPEGLHRFIPVLTGNTLFHSDARAVQTVHPRAYGEHQRHHRKRRHQNGSSPCLRGTQHIDHLQTLAARFIPVLTGNT